MEDNHTVSAPESEAHAGCTTSTMPDLRRPDWIHHPLFQQYWQNYFHAMGWYQKHMHMYSDSNNVEQTFNSKGTSPRTNRRRLFSNTSTSQLRSSASESSSKRDTTRQQKKRKKHRRWRKRYYVNGNSKDIAGCSTADECDEEKDDGIDFKLEMSEEMIKFLAQSEQHRKERDAAKVTVNSHKQHADPSQIHVSVEMCDQKQPTVEAPSERPGMRRTQEMKQLYGVGAAMIHGMETALQMSFDRIKDVYQTSTWPNIPLRISFT